MIGPIKVKVSNPPCPNCGGMAGYHSRDCAEKKLGAIADAVLDYKPPAKEKATKRRAKRRRKRAAKKG